MKIAVSGSHRTGKTTLVEALQGHLPKYNIIDEPYYLLEEEGYEFAKLPGLEDFEMQLKKSVECISENEEKDLIFDRCPLDFLAYLLTFPEPGRSGYSHGLSMVKSGMKSLDLLVFVPIEYPDRIRERELNYPVLRKQVDSMLRDLIFENEWNESGTEILEVSGTTQERCRQVLARINEFESNGSQAQ